MFPWTTLGINISLLDIIDDLKLLREGKLQLFLGKLTNKQFLTNKVYDKIYSSSSKPASIYDLP